MSETPLRIRTEDGTFSLPLDMIGTVAGVTTFTPSQHGLENCSHDTLSSPLRCDPNNAAFRQYVLS